jgi:predicted trehalose synthase
MPFPNESTQLPSFPLLIVAGPWRAVLQGHAQEALQQALPAFMLPRRWFGSKARTIQTARVVDVIPVAGLAELAVIQVDFTYGPPESYALPLAFALGDAAHALRRERPQAVVADLSTSDGFGVLYDAVWEPRFCQALLDMIGNPQRVAGAVGEITTATTRAYPRLRGDSAEILPPKLMGVEQSNTSIRYGERLILKLFRRLERGVNPDVEIGQFLTEQTAFANTPPLAGVMYYHGLNGHARSLSGLDQEAGSSKEAVYEDDPAALAILQGFVSNQGDAWRYTLDSLSAYFDRLVAQPAAFNAAPALPQDALLTLVDDAVPERAVQTIGAYLPSARLLGQRTAEMHLALATGERDPAFAPEPFNADFQGALQEEMCALNGRIMALLRGRLAALRPDAQAEAAVVLSHEVEIARRFDILLERPIHALRTRIHGDYHLGQVLYTGQDFMIIDFEGEPARPLSARRAKRSAMQDVAGMLRSFHYAAYAAFFDRAATGAVPPAALDTLEAWTRYWHTWVSAAFLQTYLQQTSNAPFLPAAAEELKILLDAYLLEKAIYELGYELNNRPDWVKIPLEGILHTLSIAN